MNKTVAAAVAGVVAAVSIGIGGAASAYDKSITLTVDGQPEQVHVWGTTVSDALAAHEIELNERDEVIPAADERITDGSQIEVRYARPITVIIDGESQDFWTTATTLSDALTEIGLHDSGARLSVDRSTPLGREGLTFSAVTPKDVQIVFNGSVIDTTSTASDVLSLLNDNGISVDSDDRITPAPDTPVTAGMQVGVQIVEIKEVPEEQPVDFTSIKTEDPELAKGQQKVTVPGVKGAKTVLWQIVYVDGAEESRAVISETITTAPIDEQVTVGTKVTVAPPQSYSGSHADWMAAAGISPSDYSAVEILIQRESSWNPNAVNPSSGACGLVQALPCSKLGPNWNDPVTALIWGDGYVKARYGGWQGALAHSYANGWY